MVDYIVTANIGLANSIVARMNILMGYPNAPTETDRYTTPLLHQADKDTPGAKRHLVIIKEVWAPALEGTVLDDDGNPVVVQGRYATVADINGELNPAELNAIQIRESLIVEGAFPDDGQV